MSYQQERDRFVAQMAQEGLPLAVTTKLLRAATTLQRYAELACSSEAADRDRVACPGIRNREHCVCDYQGEYERDDIRAHVPVPRITVLEDRLTRRLLAEVTAVAGWTIDTQGDPRGYVLRVIPPSYAERNKGKDRGNLDTIGVPSGPTRLRF